MQNKLDFATQLHQQIIINQNFATIFTPPIDKATILCNHLPAETSTLNVGINFIQQYANCTIATSEFIQKNLNQNQISDTIQLNNLNQLITTGLSEIDASFDNININKVINHLNKLNIMQSHLPDNIRHIVTNIQLAEYQEPAIKLQFSTDKTTNGAIQITLAIS